MMFKIHETTNETGSNIIELSKGKIDINLNNLFDKYGNEITDTITTIDPTINIDSFHEIMKIHYVYILIIEMVMYLIKVSTSTEHKVFQIKESSIEFPKLVTKNLIIDNQLKIKNDIIIINNNYISKTLTNQDYELLIFKENNSFIIEHNIKNTFILIVDNYYFSYFENINLKPGYYNINVSSETYIENLNLNEKFKSTNPFDLAKINEYILEFNVPNEILTTNTRVIFIKYKQKSIILAETDILTKKIAETVNI